MSPHAGHCVYCAAPRGGWLGLGRPCAVAAVNGLNIHVQTSTAALDRHFNRLNSACFFNRLNAKPVGHHIEELV